MNGSEHRTTIVLPAELHEQLVDRAQAADRSISAEVRVALREHIARTPGPSARANRRPAPGDPRALAGAEAA